jgi:hypothetical protein
MEEPPRIEKVTSSRGVSLSDTATILQSFIDTLDNDHGTPSHDGTTKTSAVAAAAANGSAGKCNTPRKTRQELEEESILKQFDLLSKQINSGLVTDDTYERLKLIRDSMAGEVCGKPLLPSQVKKVDDDDAAADFAENEVRGDYDEAPIKEEEEENIDESQQFINELNKVEDDLIRQEEDERRKKAKKAKKEKKKAKKEAKREKRRASRESNGNSEKRIKVEMSP